MNSNLLFSLVFASALFCVNSKKSENLFFKTDKTETINLVTPEDLTVKLEKDKIAKLIWTDNSVNESGFSIERKETADSPWLLIGCTEPNATSFIDTDHEPSTYSSYRIVAFHSTTISGYSNVAQATFEKEQRNH